MGRLYIGGKSSIVVCQHIYIPSWIIHFKVTVHNKGYFVGFTQPLC